MKYNFPDLEDKVFIGPTDTIIGLGCLSRSKHAVEKIYDIKNRKRDKPLLLLVGSFAELEKMVIVSNFVKDLMHNTHKPTTIIYDKILNVPDYLLSEDGTIGIRFVVDPFLVSMIHHYECPLVSTSANFAGAPTAIRFSDIEDELVKKVDYVFQNSAEFYPSNESSAVLRVKGPIVEVLRK